MRIKRDSGLKVTAKITTEDINFLSIVEEGFQNSVDDLVDNVKASFSKSSTPNVKSGQLRDSIIGISSRSSINIGVSGNSPASDYALAQELGAVITPTNYEYLHFYIEDQDQWVKTKQVILSPRPFLRPMLNQNSARIILDNIERVYNA